MNNKSSLRLKAILIIEILCTVNNPLAVEICDQYGMVDVNGGEYKVQNNVWGAGTAQCINVNGTSFEVTKSDHNQDGVASYPSIFKGCHWETCTNSSGMPIKVSEIQNAIIDWSVSTITDGKWQAGSEAWFKTNSNPGSPDGAELMLLIEVKGEYTPAEGGVIIDTVSIEGSEWVVWYAEIGWNFVTYKRTSTINSVTIDYKPFIDDAVSRGYVQNSWYMMDIEAGFEIYRGGKGLKNNSFSCSINTGEPIPDNQPPVITLNGDNPMYLAVGDEYDEPGAIANDNRDGDVSSNIEISGTVNASEKGTYSIEYTVSDAAGNQASETRTVYVEAVEEIVINSQPQSIEVYEGVSVTFSVSATGSSMSYQWKRDGVEIEDATDSTLTISNVSLADNGGEFSVEISNSLGTVVSDIAILTVNASPFDGLSLIKVETAPSIDGDIDAVWNNSGAYTLENVITGEISSDEDLSVNFKAVWDNSNLYLLIMVEDDIRNSSSGDVWENDVVEVYIDADNSKSESYGDNDYHYQFVWDKSEITEREDNTAGVQFDQKDTDDGYIMEISFPWSTIGASPEIGDLMGFELQVGDNDGNNREGKLAWNGTNDDAWQNPSLFGTAKFFGTDISKLYIADMSVCKNEGLNVYFKQTNSVVHISYNLANSSDVIFTIYNTSGKIIKEFVRNSQKAGIQSVDLDLSKLDITSGIYFIKVSAGNRVYNIKLDFIK